MHAFTYELTRLTIAPTRVRDAVALLEKEPPSHLLACWTTEFGDVNEVLVMRRFASEEAAVAKTLATDSGSWPAVLGSLLTGIEVGNFAMMPFLEDPTPGAFGPFHEIRTYGYKYGSLEELLSTWSRHAPDRVKLSPAPFMLYATGGKVLTIIHVWAYRNLEHRAEIRAVAGEHGIWPAPGGAARWTSQRSALLMPTNFSPIC